MQEANRYAVYDAATAARNEALLWEESKRGQLVWFNAKLANDEIARLTVELTKDTTDEAMAGEAIIEAIDTLIAPGAAAWEIIARQVSGVVPHDSAAGKAFGKLVEAVDNYRRVYWPEEFPAEDPAPENRDDALADIRMEEAREVSWGSR